MSWASEMSNLAQKLWEEGQRRQKIIADREGEALRHDLKKFCLGCDACLCYFNARWPHLDMDTDAYLYMERN